MYQTLSLTALNVTKMSWDEINRAIKRHSQRAALTFLSTLDAILENDGMLRPDTQMQLASDLIPPELLPAAAERMREARVVAFSNQPIWVLEKQVLLHADPDGEGSVTQPGIQDLALLLLAIADHLDEPLPADALNKHSDGVDWELARHLIRTSMLHAAEDTGAMLTRAWTIVADLPGHPALRTSDNRVDLDALMMQHDGMNPKTYIAAGAAVAAYYGTLSMRKQVKTALAFSPRAYFGPSELPPEVWERFCAIASLPADEYAARIREEHTRTGSIVFSFRTMREFPLVRYGDNVLPLSQRLVRRKFTEGLLWRLRDHGKVAGYNVPAYLGELFEQYIYNELDCAHAGATPTFQPRVHRDMPYKWGKQRCRSSDIVIDYGDRLVMIEVALGSPRMEETQIRAARAEFLRDVDQIIVQNARQLDRNIQALLAGKYRLPGVDPARVRRIYPVIVTFGHMPEGDIVWYEYERALNNAFLLQPALIRKDIARLQLLTAEDVELLRDLISEGTALADLLQIKDAEPLRNLGFKNFLFRTMGERLRDRGISRKEELKRVRRGIDEILLGKRTLSAESLEAAGTTTGR